MVGCSIWGATVPSAFGTSPSCSSRSMVEGATSSVRFHPNTSVSTSGTTTRISASSGLSWDGSRRCRCGKGSAVRLPSTGSSFRTTSESKTVNGASMLLPADPKANYLAHKDEIDKAIERVLTSGSYILGREVAAFEEAFAREIGVPHAIGVGSGTDALHVALRACQIGAGDAVLTVSHTAGATVSAIALTGALPVLVDVDPVTLTMDPNVLEATVSQFTRSKGSWSGAGRLRGVIPVSLYGHPADMNAIMTIARNYDLRVIEDCAQSHGASIDGRMTGAWGDLSGFSFYPTKNLGALGDGGAVATADPELAARVRLLREYGWRERHVHPLPGPDSPPAGIPRPSSRRRRRTGTYGAVVPRGPEPADASADVQRARPPSRWLDRGLGPGWWARW